MDKETLCKECKEQGACVYKETMRMYCAKTCDLCRKCYYIYHVVCVKQFQ